MDKEKKQELEKGRDTSFKLPEHAYRAFQFCAATATAGCRRDILQKVRARHRRPIKKEHFI
jgi:hypothetical protein